MSGHLPEIVIAAIVGAGIVTGLLFAFANFVLRALADLPAALGMFAMQRINETIINPLFFVLFFGTPLLCAVIIWLTYDALAVAGHPLLFSGAVAYLVGPFGITLAFNVPLNDRLAGAAADDADNVWPAYRRNWQRWNHLRTALGAAAILLLAAGLSRL